MPWHCPRALPTSHRGEWKISTLLGSTDITPQGNWGTLPASKGQRGSGRSTSCLAPLKTVGEGGGLWVSLGIWLELGRVLTKRVSGLSPPFSQAFPRLHSQRGFLSVPPGDSGLGGFRSTRPRSTGVNKQAQGTHNTGPSSPQVLGRLPSSFSLYEPSRAPLLYYVQGLWYTGEDLRGMRLLHFGRTGHVKAISLKHSLNDFDAPRDSGTVTPF